jgi:hypothetical protein
MTVRQLLACGSMVLFVYLFFVVSLAERNNEKQKEEKVLRESLRIVVCQCHAEPFDASGQAP